MYSSRCLRYYGSTLLQWNIADTMNFNHFKQLQQICVCAWHFTHDVPVGGCYKCFFIVMKRFLGPNPPSSSVLKPTTSGPFVLHLLSDMDFLVAYSNFKVRCNRDRYIDCEFRWKKDYNVGLFIGLFFIRVCASCWVYTHARRTVGLFFSEMVLSCILPIR